MVDFPTLIHMILISIEGVCNIAAFLQPFPVSHLHRITSESRTYIMTNAQTSTAQDRPVHLNRIPPSTEKKELPLKSKSGSKHHVKYPMPLEIEPPFLKLDQNDPVQANRIRQRRKAIMKGKNTAGYAAYIKEVPKDERRPRCMKTPNTPDHTLDIPSKRWLGLVKAWRVALHRYDPPDMLEASSSSSKEDNEETCTKPQFNNEQTNTKAKQLAEAAANGLLVDIGQTHSNVSQDCSPISVLSEDQGSPKCLENLDNLSDEDDDDDDLL